MRKITLLLLFFAVSLFAQKAPPKSNILVPYRVKNLWGLSDTLGKINVQPIYKAVKNFHHYDYGKVKSLFVVTTSKGDAVIDENQKVWLNELTSKAYDSVLPDPYNPKYIYVFKSGKMGVFAGGKELIKPIYTEVTAEENESFLVCEKYGIFGLINSKGVMVIPMEYIRISGNWRENDKGGPKFVWDAEGMIVDKKFYDARVQLPIVDDLPIGEKIAGEVLPRIIDLDNQKKESRHLESDYDKVAVEAHNDVAYVTKNNLIGVYDLVTKREIVKPEYLSIKFATEDRNKKVFIAQKETGFGLVQQGDKIIVPFECDDIYSDEKLRNLILVKAGKKGLFVANTIYPYFKPKYDEFLSAQAIPVSSRWQFGIYKIKHANRIDYVGENGVEFFKD